MRRLVLTLISLFLFGSFADLLGEDCGTTSYNEARYFEHNFQLDSCLFHLKKAHAEFSYLDNREMTLRCKAKEAVILSLRLRFCESSQIIDSLEHELSKNFEQHRELYLWQSYARGINDAMQDKSKDSNRILLEIIDSYERLFGQKHSEHHFILGFIGLNYRILLKHKEAGYYLNQYLDSHKQLYGPENGGVLAWSVPVSTNAYFSGDKDKGRAYNAQAIKIARRIDGGSYYLPLLYKIKGVFYGHDKELRKIYADSLAYFTKLHPTPFRNVLSNSMRLSGNIFNLSLDEVESLMTRNRALFEEAFPDHHKEELISYQIIIKQLMKQKRFAEALDLANEGVEIYENLPIQMSYCKYIVRLKMILEDTLGISKGQNKNYRLLKTAQYDLSVNSYDPTIRDNFGNPDLKTLGSHYNYPMLLGKKAKFAYQYYLDTSDEFYLHLAYETALKCDSIFTRVLLYLDDYSSKKAILKKQNPYWEIFQRICLEKFIREDEFEYKLRALYFSERSKSSILLERLEYSEESGRENEQQIESIRRQLNALRIDLLNAQAKDEINYLHKKLRQGQLELYNLLSETKNNDPTFYQSKFLSGPMDFDLLKAYTLKNEVTIVSFYQSKKALLRYLIQDGDIKISELNSSLVNHDISHLRKSVISCSLNIDHDELRNTDCKSLFLTTAHSLYVQLLGTDVAIKENLIIIPDGQISSVPFDILLTKKSSKDDSYKNLPYLIRDLTISYAYSLASIISSIDNSGNGPLTGEMLAIAPQYQINDSKYKTVEEYRSGFLGPLKFNLDEVEFLKQNFSGSFHIGAKANVESFISQYSNANVIHLATHAKMNETRPDLSFIAFSNVDTDPENFKFYELQLAGMKTDAQLVVLSACETGLGKFEEGEGVSSIAKAFSMSGAKSVISSLWSVNDASTMELMKHFYRKIRNQESPSRALRAAKMLYLEGCEEYISHPYYWAGFVHSGSDNVIKIKEQKSWNVLLLVPFVALLIILGLYQSTRGRIPEYK